MASSDPLTTPLTPSHITLLLKHHKSTVLLSVLPPTSIPTLKTLLLVALTSRGIATLPSTTISLPTNPEDIQLGILIDKKDNSKGFKLLQESQTEEETSKSKKGKGRPSKGPSGAEGTVEAAGLVDGSWVAYRVQNAKNVKDEGDEDEDLDVDMEGDPGWDVVVPTFEEADAVTEENAKDEEEDDIPIPDVGRVR